MVILPYSQTGRQWNHRLFPRCNHDAPARRFHGTALGSRHVLGHLELELSGGRALIVHGDCFDGAVSVQLGSTGSVVGRMSASWDFVPFSIKYVHGLVLSLLALQC